ncbi:MAG TPA: glutathione S-transferase family protein, partial [Polyangiaceae bacterium]
MSLVLYYHPLASFCWKVLVALYENETPFEGRIVDLSDADSRAELDRIWTVGKFPVLRNTTTGEAVPESTIILEYLDRHFPGPVKLLPVDAELRREARLWDRFFDQYVHQQMQKVVTDRLRPADGHDPFGVEEARKTIRTAYGMIETKIGEHDWFIGDAFGIVECAAAPSLYYANRVEPIGDRH